MSAHNRRFVLTSEARTDLRHVLAYTEKHWGPSRRRAYRQLLWDGLDELTRFPLLGRARPEFGPGFRSLRVGQHLVVYQPTDTEINIIRILHPRRDVDAEFADNSD